MDLRLEYVSASLKGRIFATFYKEEFTIYGTTDYTNYTTGIEDMMIEMGLDYEFPKNEIVKSQNAKTLKKYILEEAQWCTIFDFIERYLAMVPADKTTRMSKEFNRILENEVSAYRILDGLVVPVTNESELATIREAKRTPYDSINIHIAKALALYADRQNPDYENSIKESICAVEALCCIITGLTGANATLGKALKKLEEKSVHIHPAMVSGFSALYGYTSDEDGIRHGGMDFKNAPAEDAKFMLVSCSAFVNYLIEKWSKVQ